MAIPTNSACIAKKQFGSHHVASTKAIWFGPGSSITISSTAILFTIGSSNPVSSTNKFKLRFAHGWVVNLLSLQPSGMHNHRKGKEQTIFKGGTARSGHSKVRSKKIASMNHLNHSLRS